MTQTWTRWKALVLREAYVEVRALADVEFELSAGTKQVGELADVEFELSAGVKRSTKALVSSAPRSNSELPFRAQKEMAQ